MDFSREDIDKTYNLNERKNGSKFKKLVKEPDYQKIIDFLTNGKGKWNATRKNPHESLGRGSLTEQAFEYSQGEGGSTVVCHPEGVQVQCWKYNRELNSELL